MKKLIFAFFFFLLATDVSAQTVSQKLATAFSQFESDAQLKNAISSLYVIDALTGKAVFDKNSRVGLAPASTQKVITSITALELLGKDYRYKTEMGYDGELENGILDGNVYLKSSGDPTFGSWRYVNTREEKIFNDLSSAITERKIKKIEGSVRVVLPAWESQPLPDGWIWQDIGNYYGAGAQGLNWRENQYDLVLRSGSRIGDPVSISATKPLLNTTEFVSELKSAGKNTGDNAYIYLPINSNTAYVRGTIPLGESAFVISGAMPDPAEEFVSSFSQLLAKSGPAMGKFDPNGGGGLPIIAGKPSNVTTIYTHYSPTLDSIIYWFNKKSINLYGEALVKTIASEKEGFGSTEKGIDILKEFWKAKGIDEGELNMFDGSGLSPLNRVTAHAQVQVLRYASRQPWFASFYNSLPVYNGMTMKSGTITNVKGFTGYHTSKSGKKYIFSFLVNNYNGSASSLVNKMYKVLNILK